MKNYLEINQENWDKRVEVHVDSDMYRMADFMKGRSSLNKIELDLLGDISGQTVLHLQCHFGQDTLSMERMGAQCTAIDLSSEAIKKAESIRDELGLKSKFICCDTYSTLDHISEQFDIVYASYGVIGWLPDLTKWADIISKCLKPGGKLIFVEFHPVVWMYDDDFTHVQYNYQGGDSIIESETGTYAGESQETFNSVSWNHGLSIVIGGLLKAGLKISDFQEYDYSPYDCVNNMEEFSPGKYRIKTFGDKIPLVYSLVCEKD